MGFLKEHGDIESWLQAASASWAPLTDAEMRAIVRRWADAFEAQLSGERPGVHGEKAMLELEAELRADVYVFNLPGYRYLPSPTDPVLTRPYGYLARGLERIDRQIANDADAIVADVALGFTCLYTHEVGQMGEPIYVLSENGDRSSA